MIVNPRGDAAFSNRARVLAAEGVEDAAEMQRALRVDYPGAVVHERSLSGERDPTWYVYRDGIWLPDDLP
jgi:hypothetical protein